MEEKIVDVRLTEGYRTIGTDGRHEVVFDEPADKGGTDTGLTPSQVLLASLGACACITIRMYAQRKGWPLEDASVKVKLVLPGGKETPRLTQEVTLVGDLDDEQRERLRQIAGRCPVHRLVEGPMEMTEVLA